MRARIIKSAKFGAPPREQWVGDGKIVDIKCKPRDHDYETEAQGGVCHKCGERAMWVERKLDEI